jgi:putative ABC transport system substrate-binding protein
MPIIGFLGTGSLREATARVAAFRQGLSKTGYVERQNLVIECRWAECHYDRLPGSARRPNTGLSWR